MNITKLCVNCKQNNSCTMCWKTSSKKCPHFVQKTNADRIRAMSDEELAEVIACPKGLLDRMDCFDDNRDCKHCTLEWLKQSAEEDNKNG